HYVPRLYFKIRHIFTSLVLNEAAATEIYTLSLHDALPIFDAEPGQPADGIGRRPAARNRRLGARLLPQVPEPPARLSRRVVGRRDRKSTRLNSSHVAISYAVFCLKKKTNRQAAR